VRSPARAAGLLIHSRRLPNFRQTQHWRCPQRARNEGGPLTPEPEAGLLWDNLPPHTQSLRDAQSVRSAFASRLAPRNLVGSQMNRGASAITGTLRRTAMQPKSRFAVRAPIRQTFPTTCIKQQIPR
jgi:hypothetical protein